MVPGNSKSNNNDRVVEIGIIAKMVFEVGLAIDRSDVQSKTVE